MPSESLPQTVEPASSEHRVGLRQGLAPASFCPAAPGHCRSIVAAERAYRSTIHVWFAACGLLTLLTPTLRAAPAPPANLTAQVSGDTVLLAWSAPPGTSGALYCWGSNENGMLGVGEGVEMSTVPLHVMPGTTFKPGSVMSHSRLNCAVATTGRAYCWGNVGIAGVISLRGWTPQPLPGDVNFAIVRANHRRLCGIDVDGASWCAWEGPLGNGSTLEQLVPARVLVPPP
jgi:hypothetical protein